MDEINDTIGHLWNKTYQGTGAWIDSATPATHDPVPCPQSGVGQNNVLGSLTDAAFAA
jgi:hypothetical protein